MKNITKQIKKAISVNALWSISDFFYVIDILNNNGFETSYWKSEENLAQVLVNGELIAYIWQKYPLIISKEEYSNQMRILIDELSYIVLIESKDFISKEFSIEMDQDLIVRINSGIEMKSFSANDLWFYTITS